MNFNWLPFTSSGRLLRSFNCYQSRFDHQLAFTGFVTRMRHGEGAIKLVVFNGEDFCYWKNQTHNYLLSQGRAIWEII
jgi:hypothetical protein